MRRLVLNSGGLDSAVTLNLAANGASELHSLYIDLGSRQARREYALAAAQAEINKARHHYMTLLCPWLDEHPLFAPDVFVVSQKLPGFENGAGARDFVVPLRNLLLMSAAASLAISLGVDELWLGFDYHGADKAETSPSWDTRPEFVSAFAGVVRECNEWSQFEIVAPLQGNTKDRTVKLAVERGVDLAQTWSCYNGLPLSCGICSACVARKEGFAVAGLSDPIKYASEAMIRTYVDLGDK